MAIGEAPQDRVPAGLAFVAVCELNMGVLERDWLGVSRWAEWKNASRPIQLSSGSSLSPTMM